MKEYQEVTAWMKFRWLMYFYIGIWAILSCVIKAISYYPHGNPWEFQECLIAAFPIELLFLCVTGLSPNPNWKPKE